MFDAMVPEQLWTTRWPVDGGPDHLFPAQHRFGRPEATSSGENVIDWQ
ncbi:MAG: hypothetical protein ACRDWT_16115 [Jatrophihabitantaceae bacterium]